MLHFGHADAFSVHVLQVDSEAAPWKQVRVSICVNDVR